MASIGNVRMAVPTGSEPWCALSAIRISIPQERSRRDDNRRWECRRLPRFHRIASLHATRHLFLEKGEQGPYGYGQGTPQGTGVLGMPPGSPFV